MQNFKIIMIKVENDPVSQAYYEYCLNSWDGFNVTKYSAVTPDTLKDQTHNKLMFGTRSNGRELTDTEKACFYSQFNLWKKCAVENVPILILEHDAYLVKPNFIKFDPRFNVTFFGQHSMEAVMYHPGFARRLVEHCLDNKVTGPMNLVDMMVGYFNKGRQSRHALPHARFMGPHAPVKSVLDPKIGTSVEHDGTTADRAIKDKDLFKIVDLEKEGYYKVQT